MLHLEGISKRYGPRVILEHFQLALAGGASLALMGPSGSGKTTLLRLIAGLETPDEGQILLHGRPANGPQLEPHRRGVAMAFQAPALWPHLTLANNIGFGLGGLAPSVRTARVEYLLDRVGLADRGRCRPSALSLGEARRVSLARALAPQAPLLLLDEAFASLDPALRLRCLVLVREELQEAGSALIHATHDAAELEVLTGTALHFPTQQTEPSKSRLPMAREAT